MSCKTIIRRIVPAKTNTFSHLSEMRFFTLLMITARFYGTRKPITQIQERTIKKNDSRTVELVGQKKTRHSSTWQ
jgi:hypothetical protein